MSSPFINDINGINGCLAPIIPPPEDGRQSPVQSSASSTVSTWNLPTSKKQDKLESGYIPTVTFMFGTTSGQRVVLPLPETYEDAIQALVDFNHNSHKLDIYQSRLDPNQIVLEIWLGTTYAAIEPSLWSQLVQPGALVLVQALDCDGSYFMHGPVYLCFGNQAESALKTDWTIPDADDVIDRPFSYKHAVELVKRRINKGGDGVRKWKNKDLAHASFTFYALTSFKYEFLVDTQMDMPKKKKQSGFVATMKRWFNPQTMESLDERVWKKMHPEIYGDEEYWRRWVPLPGACLGVIIEEMDKERKF